MLVKRREENKKRFLDGIEMHLIDRPFGFELGYEVKNPSTTGILVSMNG
jgi:hypothetical protein